MEVYIVNGAPGSGKTTFENYVQEVMGKNFCKIFSTVDCVKKIATDFGWDGTKTPKNRKMLSDLKDLLTEWNDIPLKDIVSRVNLFKFELESFGITTQSAVFIDCREPKEIEKLKKALNAKTIIIRREEAEKKIASNHADADVLNYKYDICIYNNSSIDHLKLLTEDFIDGEGLI